MKYPSVLLFTSDPEIQTWIRLNASELECTVHVSSDPVELTRLHDKTYHVLVTSGLSSDYSTINAHITDRMRDQWIEFNPLALSPQEFSKRVNHCFAHYLINPVRAQTRPVFSAFTTTFDTGDKIYRAYASLLKQTMRDWEWVIVDDSPTDDNFAFLRRVLVIHTESGVQPDPRVRLYRRSQNSGSIGNVKNEAVSLCRGKYILELDHDDEIMPSLFDEAAEIMDKDAAVGFVYSDFYNVREPDVPMGLDMQTYCDKFKAAEKENFRYGDFISFGYGGYYCIYVPEDKRWRYVYITPNVNNVTASALISLPNHPRIWRRTVMERAGNYSENLPVCDDLEILIRTIALTLTANTLTANQIKVVKIHKPLYVQYMNAGGNNFSLIRNGEINRIGPKYLYPLLYAQYGINDMFCKKEDPAYLRNHSQIWKRTYTETGAAYEPKYVNSIVNRGITRHLCILGLGMILSRKDGETHDELNERIDRLRNLPITTELIVLDRERTPDELCSQLEALGLTRARAYAMEDCSWEDLERYAERMMCIPDNDIHIIGPPPPNVNVNTQMQIQSANTTYESRHEVINTAIASRDAKYLEIGVEWGATYRNVMTDCKTGVDPSPKWDDGTVVRKTSDAFFAENRGTRYDVVFIDGMHHAENVWRDIRNSLHSQGCVIFIDDVLPQTEEEQWRVPRKHVREDGVLKYGGSPWVGDVWKAVYMFFRMVKPESREFRVYSHPTNFRGILELRPDMCGEWIAKMPEEIPRGGYVLDYAQDMANYREMLYRDI